MAKLTAYARPSQLYRFRAIDDQTLEQELDALRGGYVFCPRYDELNDPMEGTHRESAMLREASDYKKTLAEVREAMNGFGIASFTEVYDHEPMWAHYANRFTGICVAYSFRWLLAGLPDDHELIRMHYSEKPPILLRDRTQVHDRAKLVLSNKTIRWSSEREWRLIAPARGPAKYGRLDCVSRVYVGSRIGPGHKAIIRSELRKLKIPAYEMLIDRYSIAFHRQGVLRKPKR